MGPPTKKSRLDDRQDLNSPNRSKDSASKCPNADLLCFICALFIVGKKYSITENVQELYLKCFGRQAAENGLDKFYCPDKVCSSCMTAMKRQITESKPPKFTSPSRWMPPNSIPFKAHSEVCYCCLSSSIKATNDRGHFEQRYQYPPTSNLIPAVPHKQQLPPPPASLQRVSSSESNQTTRSSSDEFTLGPTDVQPILYNRERLNDLIRVLDLSKEQAMVGYGISKN